MFGTTMDDVLRKMIRRLSELMMLSDTGEMVFSFSNKDQMDDYMAVFVEALEEWGAESGYSFHWKGTGSPIHFKISWEPTYTLRAPTPEKKTVTIASGAFRVSKKEIVMGNEQRVTQCLEEIPEYFPGVSLDDIMVVATEQPQHFVFNWEVVEEIKDATS